MNNKGLCSKIRKNSRIKGHLKTFFIDSDFPEQLKKGSTFLTNKNFNTISEYLKIETLYLLKV